MSGWLTLSAESVELESEPFTHLEREQECHLTVLTMPPDVGKSISTQLSLCNQTTTKKPHQQPTTKTTITTSTKMVRSEVCAHVSQSVSQI